VDRDDDIKVLSLPGAPLPKADREVGPRQIIGDLVTPGLQSRREDRTVPILDVYQ
jgi:hypothetical protein